MTFHHNKPVEIGLIPSTRALLAAPVKKDPFTKDEPAGLRLGATAFLRYHTSTKHWEDFTSMFKRAVALDSTIYKQGFRSQLSYFVQGGEFEKKMMDNYMFYRRIEAKEVEQRECHIIELAACKKPERAPRAPRRKVTSSQW